MLFSTACVGNKIATNTISSSDLTEREEVLLASTSDQSFVFDFNVDGTYKQVNLWVEKYEFGKKVGEPLAGIGVGVEKKGTIIFSTPKMSNKNELMFNISVDGNGLASGGSGLEIVKKNLTKISGSRLMKDHPISGKLVLAAICYSKETSMQSLSDDFYTDADRNIDEIRDYDVVYLVRSEFKKEEIR